MSIGVEAARAPRSRARGRRLPRWSVAGLAVVLGLALGRFLTFGAGDDGATSIGSSAGVGTAAGSSVAALEEAVAEDPDDPASWRLLGTAYLRQALEVGDPSFYELADRALDRAAALAPDDPEVLLGRGALALALHDFHAAERLGREAVDRLPSNAQALGILVDAQVELGRYDEAAATLQRMLDVRPDLPALARTSYLRELRGDLPGAEEAMRRAVAAGSSSAFDEASVVALLGDLERAQGDLDAAMVTYDRALEQWPGLVAAELGGAHVLAARGDVAGATDRVRDVVDRIPSPDALVLLAELQHVSGAAAAEAETAELLRLTARLQEEAGQVVDLELALFEADLGEDPARAVDLARSSYDARPENVFAADALAWALLRAGNAEAALPYAEQAVRLGTANPLLQYHAAEVFAAVGDLDRAGEHLRLALRGGDSFSVRHADAASALAARLGVEVPADR